MKPNEQEPIEFHLPTNEQAIEIAHLKKVVAGLKGHNRAFQRANELLKKSTIKKDEELERNKEMLKSANKRVKELQGMVDRLKELERVRTQNNGLFGLLRKTWHWFVDGFNKECEETWRD